MNVITTSDKADLKRLEGIISRGITTCIEVASALRNIRDERLYRGTHKTFESYCQDKWGYTRRHVNHLIQYEEVAANLGTTVPKPSSERQARELAKAPPEQQAEIWKEVVESNEKPTAKDVKAAVEKRNAPVQGEIVDDGYADVPDDEDAESFVPGSPKPQRIDEAAERARRMIPDLCKSLTLQLGNLGANGRFDECIDKIREFAR